VVDEISLTWLHAILDSIKSIGHTEPRIDNSLNYGNHFFVLRVFTGIIKGTDRDENVSNIFFMNDKLADVETKLKV